MNQNDTFEALTHLLQSYERILTSMDYRWDQYPVGSLSEVHRGDSRYFRYNLKEGNCCRQITISETTSVGMDLLLQLQEKRLVHHARPILRKNIRTLQSALNLLLPYDPTNITPLPKPEHLPDTFFLPGQLNVQKWIDDTLAGNFRLNPHKPEKRKIPTADGHLTRSKSEELWCDILAAESLLYRYDSDFRLASGRTVYPDFTVLHQRERRLIRIEHFGLMDDPKYAIDQLYKLEEYAESGLLPGRDLFFTVETKDRPLTRDRIYEVLYRSGLLPAAA